MIILERNMIDWPWTRAERGLHKRASDTESRLKKRVADIENQMQTEVSSMSSQLVAVIRDVQDGSERSEQLLLRRLDKLESDFPKFKKIMVDLRDGNQVLHDRVSYLESKVLDLELLHSGSGFMDRFSLFIRKYHLVGLASILLLLASIGLSWLLVTNM
jgi:BMFP domain-containing protein YqiC